jgi:hypothetical protein
MKISPEKLAFGVVGALVVASLAWSLALRPGAKCVSMRGVHQDMQEYIENNSNVPFTILYGTTTATDDPRVVVSTTVFFVHGQVRHINMLFEPDNHCFTNGQI